MKLKILHLSDLHHDPRDTHNTSVVLQALYASIDTLSNFGGHQYDFVIFSGDVVQAGGDVEAFTKFNQNVLPEILRRTKISRDKIFFCPGNHDIDRRSVENNSWAESGLLNELVTRDKINSTIESLSKASSRSVPVERLDLFYKAIWSYQNKYNVLQTPFVQAYRAPLLNLSVGIACFNTAWRATGAPNNEDLGHLILGEICVDSALSALGHCDLKLAVMHHPLNWLVDADRSAVEGRLQSEFDFIFCGHIHAAAPEQRKTLSGEAIISQAGTIYANRDYFNGFNIAVIDEDEKTSQFLIAEYSDVRRQFVPAERLAPSGTLSFQLPGLDEKENALVAILRRSKGGIRRRANEHISVIADSPSALRDIETQFVCPPLASKWLAAPQLDDGAAGEAPPSSTTLDEILGTPKNFVIIGRSESGKTSTGHYAAVRMADGKGDTARLPLITRFSQFGNTPNALWRATRDYAAEVSDGTLTRATIESGVACFIIVDDVDLFDLDRLQIVNSLVADYPQHRWMLLAQAPPSISPEAAAKEKLSGFSAYSIQDLSRGSIRNLSAQWLSSKIDSDETDTMFRSVMEQIHRTGLPRSGYVVSLVLWALKNTSRGELLNEAVLLENILDHLLGRMDYAGALRREFDFVSKTQVLQDLAFYIKSRDDVISHNDAVAHVVAFLTNKALNYDAAEIIRGFVTCGVLNRLQDNITFRYKRFQEFFVAGYLRDNKEALDSAIKDNSWLAFAREIDIFSARFRHESWLLDIGAEKANANRIGPPRITDQAIADYLSAGPPPDYTQTQLRRMRGRPLTAKKIDEIFDKTETGMARRRLEKPDEPAEAKLERDLATLRAYSAIELYSHLVRNLEFADGDAKARHLKAALGHWEAMLKGWLSTFRDVLAEIKEDLSEVEVQVKDRRGKRPKALSEIVELVEGAIKCFLPTVAADAIYRNLASEKLSELIQKIINETPVESLSRLLLLFVLLEIDAERALALISADRKRLGDKRWLVAAITQRLFAYYQSRPIPKAIRPKFEEAITDLELSLNEGPKQKRGAVLQRIKRSAYRQSEA